ncbi:MAG: NfeD family protein [Eubacteriales bacterium]|nr:NfeD family protein [Eubacteriales bacterium]MDD3503855.1 NfeD family protein [Eubacteriales bacterium]
MILGMPAWLFWLIIMVVSLLAEALTFNMTTIWFAAGSLIAMILALLGLSVWLQITAMVVVSIALLFLFLLIVKPRMKSKGVNGTVATNADRIIGQEAVVVVDINPVAGSGQVKVGGQIWSAVSRDQSMISTGSKVKVIEIQGVRAVVEITGGNLS